MTRHDIQLRIGFACVLGLIFICNFAERLDAAIIGTAAKVRNPPTLPFTGPDSALGPPWVGYKLGVQSTAGEIIGGLDVSISGPLHQRWVFDEDSGLPVPSTISAAQTNGDSHLQPPVGHVFFSGPAEDNPGTGSPLPSTSVNYYGVGSYLRGTWAIPLDKQSASADLAYLVVPSGQESALRIDVTALDPSGNPLAVLHSVNFLPEELYTPPVVGDREINGTYAFPFPRVIEVTLPASDDRPIEELTWSLESFTNNSRFFTPTVDPATGLFSWNASGSGLGRYDAVIRATDASGLSDTGHLTIWFPEPSSSLLLGTALCGFACCARKQRRPAGGLADLPKNRVVAKLQWAIWQLALTP